MYVSQMGGNIFCHRHGGCGIGFTGIAEGASDVAEILFYIFLAIFFTFVVSGVVVARKLTA